MRAASWSPIRRGVGNSWNVVEGAIGDASVENVDETAFVRQMLADPGTIATVDPDRIYTAGFSQGGMMAYTLACEMSDTLAAIGSVAGMLSYSPCQPEEAVSVIHVHGLADGLVPYAGGGPADLPPVEEGLDTWAQVAGCTGSKVEQPSDMITHTVRTSCQAGAAVELYTIETLVHRWPREHVFPRTTPRAARPSRTTEAFGPEQAARLPALGDAEHRPPKGLCDNPWESEGPPPWHRAFHITQ